MSKKLTKVSKKEIIEGLKNAYILTDGFSENELGLLADITEVELYETDSLIVKEDDSCRDILMIKKGTAGVESKLMPGSDIIGQIGKIRNQSVVGEFSFIDGSRHSANVRAMIDTVVFRLPYEKLNRICNKNHKLGHKLMKNLATLMSNRLKNTNLELRGYLYL